MAENEFIQTIGMDDPSAAKIGNRVDRYKARKGYVDRIALLWGAARFKVADTHFHTRGFICKGGVCCERLGPPKKKIGTVIVVYPTDSKGNIDERRINEIQVVPWVTNDITFAQLRDIHNEYSLNDHDIGVKLDGEETYQKVILQNKKECLFRKNPQLVKKLEAEGEKIFANLYLAKDLSEIEIRELLGLDTGAPSAEDTSADYSSIIGDVTE